jgi:branched-subunit amino acid transport protein
MQNISELKIIVLSFCLMALSFGMRCGFMLFKKNLQLSQQTITALRLAPVIVLGTTIAFDMFFIKNQFLGVLNPRVYTVLVVIAVFYLRRKSMDALLAGLVVWLFFMIK